MGFDIHAYVDVDQAELDQIIQEHNLDKNKWENYNVIAKHYVDKHPELNSLFLDYWYNEDVCMHEIHSSQGTNFIRDDKRFENKRYQNALALRYGKPFPSCLEYINFGLRTREDAIEIARELRVFFSDDSDLMHFADWLDETAIHCSTYELDY
jgi:hypothetical protein